MEMNGGVVRCDIRRDVMRDLGDLKLLIATKDGTESLFYDEVNLNAEVGAYAGREAYCCGHLVPTPNAGQARYVSDSSFTEHAIYFSAPLPNPTLAGDEIELVNLRGTGYHVRDVNEAINETIRFARRHAVYVTAMTEAVLDPDLGTLAIPPAYRTLEGLSVQNGSGQWRRIPRSTRTGVPNTYYVDKPNRSIVAPWSAWPYGVAPDYSSDPTTYRLDGLIEPDLLLDDSQATKVDPEWLVYQTQSTMARARFLRSPTPETQAAMGLLQNQANLLREQLASRRSPWSVDLG